MLSNLLVFAFSAYALITGPSDEEYKNLGLTNPYGGRTKPQNEPAVPVGPFIPGDDIEDEPAVIDNSGEDTKDDDFEAKPVGDLEALPVDESQAGVPSSGSYGTSYGQGAYGKAPSGKGQGQLHRPMGKAQGSFQQRFGKGQGVVQGPTGKGQGPQGKGQGSFQRPMGKGPGKQPVYRPAGIPSGKQQGAYQHKQGNYLVTDIESEVPSGKHYDHVEEVEEIEEVEFTKGQGPSFEEVDSPKGSSQHRQGPSTDASSVESEFSEESWGEGPIGGKSFVEEVETLGQTPSGTVSAPVPVTSNVPVPHGKCVIRKCSRTASPVPSHVPDYQQGPGGKQFVEMPKSAGPKQGPTRVEQYEEIEETFEEEVPEGEEFLEETDVLGQGPSQGISQGPAHGKSYETEEYEEIPEEFEETYESYGNEQGYEVDSPKGYPPQYGQEQSGKDYYEESSEAYEVDSPHGYGPEEVPEYGQGPSGKDYFEEISESHQTSGGKGQGPEIELPKGYSPKEVPQHKQGPAGKGYYEDSSEAHEVDSPKGSAPMDVPAFSQGPVGKGFHEEISESHQTFGKGQGPEVALPKGYSPKEVPSGKGQGPEIELPKGYSPKEVPQHKQGPSGKMPIGKELPVPKEDFNAPSDDQHEEVGFADFEVDSEFGQESSQRGSQPQDDTDDIPELLN